MLKRRKRNLEKVANEISEDIKEKKEYTVPVEWFGTGCTMLNLPLSGNPNWGIPRARVTNFVGDGSAGKTAVALECAYWFLKHVKEIQSRVFPVVKEPIVIYNNGEGVMDFPLDLMYTPKFRKMVDWRRSKTVESLGRDYLNEANHLKKHQSLLYIADSWDQFKSIHDAKIEETADEDIAKAMQLKKQQFAWKFFAEACDLIEGNRVDATLIVISQTRKNIGVKFGDKTYRTGGDALNFYTHLVPWLRVVKKVEKKKHGESRIYSIDSEVKVKRSKVSKPFRTAQFRILYDYGLDDIGSMLNYLKGKKVKHIGDVDISGSDLHAISKNIEKNNLKGLLVKKCGRYWSKVEDAFMQEVEERQRKEI